MHFRNTLYKNINILNHVTIDYKFYKGQVDVTYTADFSKTFDKISKSWLSAS